MIRAAPPSPTPRPAPSATLSLADSGLPDGVGLAEGTVLAGVVVTCAGRVEEDSDDKMVEEEEEVVVVEEDVVLLVTLKYSDMNKGPSLLLSCEALYIASQKRLLRDKLKLGLGSPLHE